MSSAAARYAELRAETSAAFDQLGSFLADLCEGSEAHQDSSGHEGPNLDTNLGNFYETFTALKARHADQNLTVAVLALTKSGECVGTSDTVLICLACPSENWPGITDCFNAVSGDYPSTVTARLARLIAHLS